MTEPADPSARLVDALGQTTFTIMGVLTRVAAENDMSLTQLRVLGILRDRTPRMAALADFLGLDRSTLSGLVDRSEGRGLVERTRSGADRRSIEVRLTDAGRELAARVGREVQAGLEPLIGRVDPSRRATLAALLESMLPEPEDA